jgi:hypothetical protein
MPFRIELGFILVPFLQDFLTATGKHPLCDPIVSTNVSPWFADNRRAAQWVLSPRTDN